MMLLEEEYEHEYFNVTLVTDMGAMHDVLIGLVGYLFSQEHFIREPITTRLVVLKVMGDKPHDLHVNFLPRPKNKPDPVGELLFQCMIVKAWNSPIGMGGQGEVIFKEDKDEPKAS